MTLVLSNKYLSQFSWNYFNGTLMRLSEKPKKPDFLKLTVFRFKATALTY